MTGGTDRLSWRSGHVGDNRGLPLRRVLRDTVWYGNIHDWRNTRPATDPTSRSLS